MALTVFAQTGAGPGMGGMNPEMHSRMNTHMRAMQDVRARMNTATTLEQKQALMDEHMSHIQSMMGSNWSRPSDMYSPGSVL